MAKQTETVVTQEKKVNPWQDMRETMIHAKTRSEQPTEYFNVNGHKFRVPKGVVTRVPKPIYDLIQNRNDAEKEMYQAAKENFNGDRVPEFKL